MGRIKSTLVKRTAKQLLVQSDMSYNEAFDNNKKILGNTMPSKKIRNKIAGYIGHLNRLKRESAEKASKPKKVETMAYENEMPEYN